MKIGVAGFGKIGKIRFEEINKRNDCSLTGVFDIVKPTEKLGKDVCFFDSYDELINSEIDAIFICTYNNVLADFTVRALKKGIHVFCEKPPARTLDELYQVKEVHTDLVKLKYGFNHRYHYSVMEAKKIIDSKQLGEILWMRGVYGKAGSIDYDKNWRNYKQFSGGGILIDQGIHMLDLVKYFIKEDFVDIKSFILNSFWKVEAEDNAFSLMKTKSDKVVSIHSSATQWKHKFLLEICCENGLLVLDGILSKTNSYAPEKLIVSKREFEDITFAMGKPKEETTYFSNDDSWELEVTEFIEAIKNDTHIINGTIDDAISTFKLLQNVYSSSKQ